MAARKDPYPRTLRLFFQENLLELMLTSEYPCQILQTEDFQSWIENIRDVKTSTRITNALDKMQRGLLGDWKEIGEGVFEMRLDFGPGYRLYYAKYQEIAIVILGGGDKNTQPRDVRNAKQTWKELKYEITEV